MAPDEQAVSNQGQYPTSTVPKNVPLDWLLVTWRPIGDLIFFSKGLNCKNVAPDELPVSNQTQYPTSTVPKNVPLDWLLVTWRPIGDLIFCGP